MARSTYEPGDTDNAADDEPAEPGNAAQPDSPSRAKRFGAAVVARLPQFGLAIVGGMLLCLSFPPFGWWYTAIVAFVLLGWVLTRESTTLVGGFGYGFLFGLTFYVPLLPWISGLVGLFPWLTLAVVQAVFPGLFGVLAVAVRRLPGWPLWFRPMSSSRRAAVMVSCRAVSSRRRSATRPAGTAPSSDAPWVPSVRRQDRDRLTDLMKRLICSSRADICSSRSDNCRAKRPRFVSCSRSRRRRCWISASRFCRSSSRSDRSASRP